MVSFPALKVVYYLRSFFEFCSSDVQTYKCLHNVKWLEFHSVCTGQLSALHLQNSFLKKDVATIGHLIPLFQVRYSCRKLTVDTGDKGLWKQLSSVLYLKCGTSMLFDWSCVSSWWDVRHRNFVENPLNVQVKTPCADWWMDITFEKETFNCLWCQKFNALPAFQESWQSYWSSSKDLGVNSYVLELFSMYSSTLYKHYMFEKLRLLAGQDANIIGNLGRVNVLLS